MVAKENNSNQQGTFVIITSWQRSEADILKGIYAPNSHWSQWGLGT